MDDTESIGGKCGWWENELPYGLRGGEASLL